MNERKSQESRVDQSKTNTTKTGRFIGMVAEPPPPTLLPIMIPQVKVP